PSAGPRRRGRPAGGRARPPGPALLRQPSLAALGSPLLRRGETAARPPPAQPRRRQTDARGAPATARPSPAARAPARDRPTGVAGGHDLPRVRPRLLRRGGARRALRVGAARRRPQRPVPGTVPDER